LKRFQICPAQEQGGVKLQIQTTWVKNNHPSYFLRASSWRREEPAWDIGRCKSMQSNVFQTFR